MTNQAQTRPGRPLLERIFISADEPRLRAVWRLIGQAFFLLLALLFFGGIYTGLGLLFPALFDEIALIGSQTVSVISITLSVYLARRFLDHRSFASLGVALHHYALPDVAFGILIAGVLMAGVYAFLWLAGWLQYEGLAWHTDPFQNVVSQTAVWLLVFLATGWQEELLARGYQLQNIAAGLNLPWGVILSSLVFSVLHLANPGAGWPSALGILAAGLFLAYGYVRTRSLWLPIGLHIGWNFFEGVVFGFQVSGLETYRVIRATIDGPELITGGVFGPEAGLVVLPFLALGASLIYLYTGKRLENQG